MKRYVDEMKAMGGGDTPEAMASGLFQSLNLPYRDHATKVCILIADAPPHGLAGPSGGDSLPNGDTDCEDLLSISRQLASRGIRVYMVGCEPSIVSFVEATSWMKWTAELCSGRYISLTRANLLSSIIIGGCREEINLDKLAKEVRAEMDKLRSKGYDIQQDLDSRRKLASLIANQLNERKLTTLELHFDELPNAKAFQYYNVFHDAKDLNEAKEMIKASKFEPYADPKQKAGVTKASDEATVQVVSITEEHVIRVFHRI